MINNIGAYSQVDYDRGYQQGRADGYSQAENDYFAQSQKDREDTYNCGYAIGRNDAIEKCAEILAHKFFCAECPIRCRKCEFEKCKDKWFEYLMDNIKGE